jgi:hypothetical protein
MGIKNVSKKVGLWIIKPSILGNVPGASNPFYDAMKLVKDAKRIKENDTIDSLSRASTARRNHTAFIQQLMSIPKNELRERSLMNHALSILVLMLWLSSIAITYMPFYADLQFNSPVLLVIMTHFKLAFHMAVIVFSIVFIYTFLSYRWRAKLFASPEASTDFINFITTPSKW